jgi:replicative DNA helicase
MLDNSGPRYPLEGLAVRQPPSNIDAEAAVLGALLSNNRAIDQLGEHLMPEHFYDPLHGRIYAECCRRIIAGQMADGVLLKEWFAKDPDAHAVGGPDKYLAHLVGSMISIDHVKPYADAIIDCWKRRKVLESIQLLVDQTFNFGKPIEQSAADHASTLDALVTDQQSSAAVTFNSAMDSAVERAKEAKRRGGHGGVQIPLLPALGRKIAIMPGELTVLGGQPGEGKSAIGWQMVISAAEWVRDRVRGGTPISELGGFLGISLEMSKEALATRALCAYAGQYRKVPVSGILHGNVSDQQLDALEQAKRDLQNLPIEIIAVGGLTPSMIRMRFRQARRKFKGKIALCIIDHVLLINPEDKDARNGGAWATGKIADALLAMGKEFDCHMLGLCQLDIKDIAKRTEKRPTKADLRWSANWANNADNILFIHRPEMYLSASPPDPKTGEIPADYQERYKAWQDEREQKAGRAELIIDKCRHGDAPSMLPLFFDKESITFCEDPSPSTSQVP